MDVHIGSKDGPSPSLAKVADQFNTQIGAKEHQWLQTLTADPAQLAQVEEEVHLTFSKLADHTVAAILAKASERPEMQAHQKKLWIQRLNPFARRRDAR